MSVVTGLLSKENVVLSKQESVCFARITSGYEVTSEAQFLKFYPTSSDPLYTEFLKTFWHLRDVLDGYANRDIIAKGVQMDIDKYSAFEIFVCFVMVRYPQQVVNFVSDFNTFSTRYPTLSALQIWVLCNLFPTNLASMNTEYTFFRKDQLGNIEHLCEDSFTRWFPEKEKSYREQQDYSASGHVVPMFEAGLTGIKKAWSRCVQADWFNLKLHFVGDFAGQYLHTYSQEALLCFGMRKLFPNTWRKIHEDQLSTKAKTEIANTCDKRKYSAFFDGIL